MKGRRREAAQTVAHNACQICQFPSPTGQGASRSFRGKKALAGTPIEHFFRQFYDKGTTPSTLLFLEQVYSNKYLEADILCIPGWLQGMDNILLGDRIDGKPRTGSVAACQIVVCAFSLQGFARNPSVMKFLLGGDIKENNKSGIGEFLIETTDF